MAIDYTSCLKSNVIDTCSIWNILSSRIFYAVLQEQQFDFCITKFVEYECLYRERTNPNVKELELKARFEKELRKNKFPCHKLSIEDLQHEDILNSRGRFGKGELSSIAFAKKTGIAFLTDDQGARKRGGEVLGKIRVQTCPLLFGWTLLKGFMIEKDHHDIIREHISFERPLEKHFRKAHEEAMRIKYLESISKK